METASEAESEALIQMLPKQPAEGEKCNGCGACCIAQRCQIAVMANGERKGPCEFLIMNVKEKKFACEFVVTEKRFNLDPQISKVLGIGKGCYTEGRTWEQV